MAYKINAEISKNLYHYQLHTKCYLIFYIQWLTPLQSKITGAHQCAFRRVWITINESLFSTCIAKKDGTIMIIPRKHVRFQNKAYQ